MTVQAWINAFVVVLLAIVALTAVGMSGPTYGPLGERSPRVPVTDETAGSNPAGVATSDLLSGKACIPVSELLRNRPTPAIHSYSRSIAC